MCAPVGRGVVFGMPDEALSLTPQTSTHTRVLHVGRLAAEALFDPWLLQSSEKYALLA